MKKEKTAVDTIFTRLRGLSIDLNSACDELSECCADIEELLQGLNLGVTAWTPFDESADWRRELGYAKVDGKWGLALRIVPMNDPPCKEELWAFTSAPRWLRIDSLVKLPFLLEVIATRAEATAELLRKRIVAVSAHTSLLRQFLDSTKAGE